MMRMIKRFFAMIIISMLLLCACGETEQPVVEDNLIVIGMSQVGAESDWRVANSESMKEAFSEKNGYRLLFDDARQKQENQFTSIRRFIQQRVDYIVVMPISEDGWESVLEEARDAGIPVIVVDRRVNVGDGSLVTAHVGADFYAEGTSAVEWIEKNYANRDRVNIVHIRGTMGSTAQIGRTGALTAAFRNHTNWNLIKEMDGDFTQAKTYEVMRDYLESSSVKPVIDVVYCENDNEAFGAIDALEEAGYKCGDGGVAVISFDATHDGLVACRDGKIALEVECNPLLGPLAESVVRTIEEGGIPEKNQNVEERVFLPEDITDELLESRGY